MSRIPRGESPTEIRKAFQVMDASVGIILEGTAAQYLQGQGVGTYPIWIDPVTLTAGSGLVGGGDISNDRTFDLDINSLSVASVAAGDFLPFWDISVTATNRKVTFGNLEGALTHDNLIAGTIASHDTSATGTQLDTLTDNSMADALHRHSELSASDGTPDQALIADAIGQIGIGISTPDTLLHIMVSDASASSNAGSSFTLEKNGVCIMQFLCGITNAAGILFGDSDSDLRGFIRYDHNDDSLQLWTAGSNKFTIKNTGWTLVGTTTAYAPFTVFTTATVGRQAVTIFQNDIDKAFIDFQGTSAANANNNISTWGGGGTIQGFTLQEINGVEYWIPHYSAPTTATDPLTDNSMVDTLHRHSELSASDGTPDAIVQVDAAGQLGVGTQTPNEGLTLEGGVISLFETTTPTATANYAKLYSKNTNTLYFQDGAGNEHLVHGDSFSNMWYHGSADTVSIATADLFTLIDSFENVGVEDAQGNVTSNTTNNEMTIGANGGGSYKITFHASITSSGANSDMVIAPGVELVNPIVIALATNATPIVCTKVAHGLKNGDMVTIADCTGNTGANGDWMVTAKTADTFTLVDLSDNDSVGNGAYDADSGSITICFPGNIIFHRIVNQTDLGMGGANGDFRLVAGDKIALYVANVGATRDLEVVVLNMEIFRQAD